MGPSRASPRVSPRLTRGGGMLLLLVTFHLSLAGAESGAEGVPVTRHAASTRSLCVVVVGTLTRAAEVEAGRNAEVLRRLITTANVTTVTWHFVGGAEVRVPDGDGRTYTAPTSDDVDAELARAFPGKAFAGRTVQQREYHAAWPEHFRRATRCCDKVKRSGANPWCDEAFFKVNSRQAMTLAALGEYMRGGDDASRPRCSWVIGYRSDYKFSAGFPTAAAKYLFNPSYADAWINREFDPLVSRTDVFIARRAVVATLGTFASSIWSPRSCPVDRRLRHCSGHGFGFTTRRKKRWWGGRRGVNEKRGEVWGYTAGGGRGWGRGGGMSHGRRVGGNLAKRTREPTSSGTLTTADVGDARAVRGTASTSVPVETPRRSLLLVDRPETSPRSGRRTRGMPRRVKTWCEIQDVSAAFERQLGQFLLERKIRVLNPHALRGGKIVRDSP